MEEKINEEYISLFEASKLCSYSEPYLRLRARQGKLKSIKLGKKWMTTEFWIKDYIKKTKEWNDKIAAKKVRTEEKEDVAPQLKQEVAREVSETIQVGVPDVLIISEISSKSIKDKVKENNQNEVWPADRNPMPDFALVVGSALMFALAIFFAVSSENNSYTPLNSAKDLLSAGQAAAKKSIDASASLTEMSNDLLMPDCFCKINNALNRDGAKARGGFLTGVAKKESKETDFFNFFWPW